MLFSYIAAELTRSVPNRDVAQVPPPYGILEELLDASHAVHLPPRGFAFEARNLKPIMCGNRYHVPNFLTCVAEYGGVLRVILRGTSY